ncbi:cell division protein FtsZ [Pyruvatibacter mobilis]|uniref:cell division protein FtsZ n=1 Tax=Pyruvatibacter mobilis TaxID=1712261 RepID=UPI003C7D5294
MTINLSVPEQTELKPRITVFGVGGAGGNGVNNMIESGLEGVDFVVANTDAQALAQSLADRRIQMGTAITQGLGAGSRPQVGEAAAEEALDEITQHLTGCHMAFITAGMGGGTGTGGAPVIARAAREMGILTVGVVTKPFQFEGSRRLRIAEEGIEELQRYVDTLIVIPNQNLFRVANEKTTFADAFSMADEVLHSGVAGITDLMVRPGLINLDFADVRTVMNEMGKAMMGTGEATGETRAIEAAEAAISNPLLDEVSMKGARGVLINITGGMDMTLYEVDEAANRIREEVDPDANIIVGSTFDTALDGSMRVSVVATGIDCEEAQQPVPQAPRASEPVRGFRLKGQSAEAAPAASASVSAQPETAVTAADTAAAAPASDPLPPLGDDIDPSEYEAEVIIHKPQQAAAEEETVASEPIAEPEAPVAATRGAVVSREQGAAYIAPEAKRLQAKPRKKAPSFFERITGGARARDDDAEAAGATPLRQPARPAAQGRVEPRMGQRPVSGGQRPAPEAPRQAISTQQTAAAPARDLTPDPVEEEQLEIPAFLRRQAN